jgi:hypothetical protein
MQRNSGLRHRRLSCRHFRFFQAAAFAYSVLTASLPAMAAPGLPGPAGVKQNGATSPNQTPGVGSDEGDEVLVEVRVDQQILAESMAARPAPDGSLRLPLGELARALGLAITVKPELAIAEGFVLREDRTFRLEANHGLVILAGRPVTVDPSTVEIRPDDLYIDIKELGRWLPLSLEYDPFSLIVKVLPREPLPAQLRLERERRAELGGEAPANPDFPFVATPYALFGQPSLDPTIGLSFDRDDQGRPRPGITYAALADMDLVGLNWAAYATGSNQLPLADWHVTAGRKDPDGGLFGPLRAREASVGYVLDAGMPLIAGTWTGNGVTLSSYPLTQPTRFDRESFRGPLPPGWDAQLFQNGFPIAYQPTGSTGEFRFDDIPLAVGPNEFRIVLNGPQGQRREDVRRLNIGATLTPAGENRYRVTQGFDNLGNSRTMAIYEQGITKQISGAAGAARLTLLDGSTRIYGLAGARGTLGEVFWHADAAANSDGGVAGEAGAQLAAGPLGASLSQSVGQGFLSETFRAEVDPIMARTIGRVDARTADDAILPGTLVVTGTLERRVSGALLPLITNQIASRLGPLRLSNALDFDPLQPGLFTDGTAEVGGQLLDILLRGQAFYTPTGVTALALVTSGQIAGGYRYTVGASYPLQSRLPQLSLDLNHTFGGLTAGINLTAALPGTVTAAVNLASGLAFGAGGWQSSAVSLATTGSAMVHAFVDTNQNGRFDPGERPLAGLVVDLGGNQLVKTNAEGFAIETGLGSYTPVDADFSHVVLDDPLLIPALKGVRYVPRPGRTTLIELAVVAVGEVYGTVRIDEGAGPRDFPGATVELVDPEGQVVATTLTGLDGYYGLTAVRPGKYELRVAPTQLEKLGLGMLKQRETFIPGEGIVLDAQDFLLKPIKKLN